MSTKEERERAHEDAADIFTRELFRAWNRQREAGSRAPSTDRLVGKDGSGDYTDESFPRHKKRVNEAQLRLLREAADRPRR